MNAKKEIEEIKYPRFITDKPEGKDLLDGQPQHSIAENIIQFLREKDNSKRKVIGIEGEWGSGKSNVIGIIESKVEEEYYFFIFDAWGHQEDLTRRSILEELLSRLIKDSVLKDDKDWKEKLKQLLAKKVEKQSKNIPKLSWVVIWSVLGIVFTTVSKYAADIYLKSQTTPSVNPTFWEYSLALLIYLSPFIPLLWHIAESFEKVEKHKRKEIFQELFYVFKGKEIETTSNETISENEPSVRQFIEFLTDIEKSSKKKIVIVFDNMDRLPASKVKEVWSSIHTFFASDDNDLKTWAIVPFDNEHICNIFIDEEEDKHRADSYIHKTFSIVFHIPPPILSNWKKFFSSKFKEAFGELPPKDSSIETIFDYYHIDDPKIKLRDIIYYINDIVALKKIWIDKIPFKYLALFAIKRTEIMNNPFENILTRNYLGKLTPLFVGDESLETYIAALAFNVPIDQSDEILLRRPIENVLKGEGDLIKVSKHKSFFNIFTSVFYGFTPPKLINTISCLNALSDDISQDPSMDNYWETLSRYILRVNPFEIKYIDSIKILTRRLKSSQIKNEILKFLFIRVITPDQNNNRLFVGEKYYNFIKEIELLLKEVWPEKSVIELL